VLWAQIGSPHLDGLPYSHCFQLVGLCCCHWTSCFVFWLLAAWSLLQLATTPRTSRHNRSSSTPSPNYHALRCRSRKFLPKSQARRRIPRWDGRWKASTNSLRASPKAILCSLIRYAMTIGADRETPMRQCTSTRGVIVEPSSVTAGGCAKASPDEVHAFLKVTERYSPNPHRG
jgi:hypothetical protein